MRDKIEREYMNSDAYWVGWLSATVAGALRELRRHDASDADRAHAVDQLEQGWEAFAHSPVCERTGKHLDEMQWMGFVVESATGEPQAYRETHDAAEAALADIDLYYDGARTCGHPDANRYVDKLYPMTIRQITKAEALELAEFPAVIDREG